ncbi:glycoside hydrolase family 71/99-like protein [Dyadobacter frigoris]|uniref:Xylosidase n=1 Tax=Dyadobacter frigoris TaxID=2576211 RepID=A0A4U6D1G2_9BACT|nr:glycoside hydrolase family 71/99-like protein [Dyadobacter frigoris]TKT91059.1 xylosidase [Dyadobacter frigoris]
MKLFVTLCLFLLLSLNCQSQQNNVPDRQNEQIKYDETGCLFTTYKGLVMAGYQGWFTAEGDGSGRGWHHYQKEGKFEAGFTSVDFWPEVSEYTKTYKTAFKFADGNAAKVFSPYDESTVDLHFKWMKEHGIDGVYMQRFVSEIKSEKGKNHFNKVLANALKAAKKYGRALSIMYDLSGSTSADMDFIARDWEELQVLFKLFDNKGNPTYLRYNGRPLLAIWGVGFNDNRKYTIEDIQNLVGKVKGTNGKISVLLGVPYYWRSLSKDTENSTLLHTLIKSADIIMPWAVGRYNADTYNSVAANLQEDITWCSKNKIGYIPLVFPGFSWGNLKNDKTLYNQIPRAKGDFLWKQIAGAKMAGAEALYVAMFDEIDEGTAIFKTKNEKDVPLNGDGKFAGIETDLSTDYYLWLTGQGAKWFHGNKGYNIKKPVRQK